MDNGGFNTMY
jgi:hypothetical protein